MISIGKKSVARDARRAHPRMPEYVKTLMKLLDIGHADLASG